MRLGDFIKNLFRKDNKDNEDESNEYYKIDFAYYDKVICTLSLSDEEIMELLKIHYELNEDEFHVPSEFYIRRDEEDEDLAIIKCPADIDFYEFHNLISAFECNVEDDDNLIYGIAKSSLNPSESYYVYIDEDYESYDTLCGVMDNGDAISIYLPESYLEGGNIEIDEELEYDIVGVEQLIEWIKEDEDDIED